MSKPITECKACNKPIQDTEFSCIYCGWTWLKPGERVANDPLVEKALEGTDMKRFKLKERQRIEAAWKGHPIQPMFNDQNNHTGHQYIPKIKGKFSIKGSVVKGDPYKINK